jgi:uncharacterized membrane protein YeaQ/YmgE (transglycosylase-associated protein family)
METKTYIWVGIFIGSTVGGWLGAVLDHGNWFGLLSFLLGTVGSFVGVWVGYKISQN